MSRPAIVVEDLSKSYRLGAASLRPSTLREALTQAMTAPLRRFREAGEARADEARTFWALRDVSFEVQPGEVVGIIGRNGAGKSTLLKVLSRIVEPTGGTARLRGRMASLLEVGTGFHPELTGRENIFLNGSILGMKHAEIARRFDEIVAFAGVEAFIDTPVKRYSSGMYVRLAFSVAAHLEPEILIIDEVLAVGDAEFQSRCLGKMREISRGHGRTVLFVSHNLNAVIQLCRNCILLGQGRVEKIGPSVDVMKSYAIQAKLDAGVDLSDHPNRAPSMMPIFRRIDLIDAKGDRSAVHFPDSPVEVQLRLRCPMPIPSPKIAIAVGNWRGERIFAVATYLTPDVISMVEGETTVVAGFDLPALPPGTYSVDVSISGENTMLDEINSAIAFEVPPCNYLGSTAQHAENMGLLMVRSNWKSIEPRAGELAFARGG
jgi:lipopolysaccharide transport system ATP-binding protein